MTTGKQGDALQQAPARFLKQFRSVLAVDRAGSTSAASAQLPLSQSAVARAIRELESGLGTVVFERSPQGMLLTAEGQLLAYRAGRAMAQLQQAEAEAAHLAERRGANAPATPGRFAAACSYRHVNTYLVFCEARSESAAARQLGVSQPAVSQTLRQLEHMLGTSLYQRSARGLRLTESGEAVLRRAKLAMDEFRLAQEDLGAFRGKMRGRIVVGALPLSAGALVPRAVEQVLALNHELHVTIVDGTYDALMHQLQHAEVDIIVGALRLGGAGADVNQETLFTDTLSVVVRQGHPLLQRSPSGLHELVDESWLVPLSGTPARAAFERAFAAEGVAAPHGPLEVNSAAVLQALLLESDRLALVSRRQVAREVSAGLLAVLPVKVKQTTRHIGITTRSDADPGAGLRLFMEQIRVLARDQL
ncbi:MAG TPA: LysR family transcriptional regulator [Pusillimonas sp.]|uniref:LysR family transcriptional regulator n=1 Tax=Pusillimonas sp. TaxID=3040095 RepID=UPI002CAB1656|nr:LysR family transcriptional regulator [Pusillimonas sp.]HUH87621.1 LysR family transcriptional regulator [Pusillimonas sp.]